MPKRTAALGVLLVLALTGCAGAAETTADERTAPTVTESAAPLEAETPAPDVEQANPPDVTFLAYVRDNLLPDTQIPNATDEQLIEAGWNACAQLESGTKLEDVRVVEGETPYPNGIYYDTSAIMNGAIVAYCPDAA